jgi:diguanylate cyclase (GGDEF)-like protein/PAS domain S-box-containing protein
MPAALVLTYLLAAVAASVPGRLMWRRRHASPLALPLVLILCGLAEWSLVQALATAADPVETKRVLNRLIFPGVCAVVAGVLWHTVVYTGYRRWMTRRMGLVLAVEPAVVVLALLTDPWHHLFYCREGTIAGGPDPPGWGSVLVVHPGPLYWAHTGYSYVLLTAASVLLVRACRRAVRGHRRLHLLVLLAMLAPTTGNLATLFRDLHTQGADLTPVLFLVPATVWWWNERKGFHEVPIAAGQVLAALNDAVMVLDVSGRFLDANPAATDLVGTLAPEDAPRVLGRSWPEVVGPTLAAALRDREQRTLTTRDDRTLDLRVAAISTAAGKPLGWVVVVRDITEVERLRAELAELADRDGLTQLHNRRYLERVLTGWEDSPAPEPFAVVMIDIDHFKQVNDRYGHAVGDEVLRALALHLQDEVRSRDIVARYGGEEFVVLLPGAGPGDAAARAEGWRRWCAENVLDTHLGQVRVTLSAGIAGFPGHGRVRDLLRVADTALYRAKAQGRDQVVVATAPDPGTPPGTGGAVAGAAGPPRPRPRPDTSGDQVGNRRTRD